MQLWADHTTGQSDPLTLNVFLQFVERRIDATQTLMNSNNIATNPPMVKHHQKVKPRVLQFKGITALLATETIQ